MRAAPDFQAFVDDVKARTALEDVIEETGAEYVLRRTAGREIHGVIHDSLQVNTQDGLYKWFSKNEGGDVFSWLRARKGMQFYEALEYLAGRARLEMPRWQAGEGGQDARQLEARGREDVFSVAQPVMAGWLHQDDEVMAYLGEGPTESGKARHFDLDTIALAGIGFTGRDTQRCRDEMRAVLVGQGIDPECPAAVAILGYRGDVGEWGRRWNVDLTENPEWVGGGYLGGLLAARRVVYPHLVRGRCRYYSCRNILGSDVDRDGRERKSYNLPKALVPRQLYQNWLVHRHAGELVVVEGPGDAVALGQMGMAAVALLGLGMANFETELRALHLYKNDRGIEAPRVVYLGIDADQAGWESLVGKDGDWPSAKIFGPMARVANWQMDEQHRKFELKLPIGSGRAAKKIEVKDANDYLAALVQAGKRAGGGCGVVTGGGAVGGGDGTGGATAAGMGAGAADGQEVGSGDEDGGRAPWVGGEDASGSGGMDLEGRLRECILGEAEPLVMRMATWVSTRKGAERDAAVRLVLGVAAQMGELDRAQWRAKLAKRLDFTLRELDGMIKAVSAASEKVKATGEPVSTWGGVYSGWLVEYLYDVETDFAKLAWRDPDGVVGCGESVQIEGQLLVPYPSNESLRNGTILFPSDLGERKTIRELVIYVRMYLESIYLLPSERMSSLVAYWILTTWVYDSFETVIYLRAIGGTGSGKSELMKRIGMVCYRMMTANGAGSTSSLFRTLERYKGTVFIDEADIQNSDTENDMVKFYNLGAMRGNPIWRTVEVIGPNGEKDFDQVGFRTFCPKLVAMRKEFRDDAIGSRSLTMKMVAREMPELKAAGIPLTLNNAIRAKAQTLRNMLLRWRMEAWEPEILVDFDLYDMGISARLNQVAGPLLAIARDDPEQQVEIRTMLREYYAETILNQSMTISARVIEAMWKIWQYPDLRASMVRVEPDGEFVMKVGDVTKITNAILDEMNDEDASADDMRKNDKSLKPQRVGRILRDELQFLISKRRRDGFWVYWNEPKMEGLSTKFGIDPKDFMPKTVGQNLKNSAVAGGAVQNSLVNL